MRLIACFLAVGLVASGCAVEAGSEDDAEEAAQGATRARYDIHRLLEDDDIRGGADVTVDQVQAFLEAKGSFLASYTDPTVNKPAAEVIVEECRAHGINPIYMLARIQTESSLVGSGTSRHLAAATGCACPDGRACSRMERGFAAQVECAAEYMEEYFDEMDRNGQTRAGWGVGRAKRTLDPCSITPANKATAALYTYTPWVGRYGRGCGKSGVSGSSMIADLYTRYRGEIEAL